MRDDACRRRAFVRSRGASTLTAAAPDGCWRAGDRGSAMSLWPRRVATRSRSGATDRSRAPAIRRARALRARAATLVTLYRRRIIRRLESLHRDVERACRPARAGAPAARRRRSNRVMPSSGARPLRQPSARAQTRVTLSANRVRIMRARLDARRRQVNVVPCCRALVDKRHAIRDSIPPVVGNRGCRFGIE